MIVILCYSLPSEPKLKAHFYSLFFFCPLIFQYAVMYYVLGVLCALSHTVGFFFVDTGVCVCFPFYFMLIFIFVPKYAVNFTCTYYNDGISIMN